jgi:hypothetical protein
MINIERSVLEAALARTSRAPLDEFLRAKCDYVWTVPPDQKYSAAVPPGPFTLGQLSESAQWIISGLHQEDIAPAHAVWIADIIRGIAYDNVTEDDAGQSLALTRDELWIAARSAISHTFEGAECVQLAWDTSWAFSRIAVYQEIVSESDLVSLDIRDGLLFVERGSSDKETLFWLAETLEALGHFSLS